jgi:hypothetical protein
MFAATGDLPTPESAATPTKAPGLLTVTDSCNFSQLNLLFPGPRLDLRWCPLQGYCTASLFCCRPSNSPTSTSSFRHPLVTESTSLISSDPIEVPRKRSSISYKSSFQGLPTPELTPTKEGRLSDIDWSRHASLTNEQHFLYQSLAALVARISKLDHTLSSRSQPRPVSFAASNRSLSDAEPSDEMFLIADLKAERDELKRDIDGWRTRVADLEKQSGAFALRVDTECRDSEAWIARERLSLLEVEKRAAVRAGAHNYQGGFASCARGCRTQQGDRARA